MRVMVFEHVCGGGMNRDPLPAHYAAQGGAMLTALVADLARAGHDVVTTRDERWTQPLNARHVRTVRADESIADVVDRLLGEVDAAVVIAPECDGVLIDWLGHIEASGVANLGCTAAGAAACADKLALASRLAARNINTPPTCTASEARFAPPVVIKPRFGAGCESTRVCAAIPRHIDAGMIVQLYVDGTPASASFIVTAQGVQPLLAGAQHIERMGDDLHYRGGSLPLEPDLSARALRLARRAVEAVGGLRGFVGVDLVLSHDDARDDCVIEINPRLTLSYVALRALCTTNLAAAMIDPRALIQWRSGRVCFDASGQMLNMLEHA